MKKIVVTSSYDTITAADLVKAHLVDEAAFITTRERDSWGEVLTPPTIEVSFLYEESDLMSAPKTLGNELIQALAERNVGAFIEVNEYGHRDSYSFFMDRNIPYIKISEEGCTERYSATLDFVRRFVPSCVREGLAMSARISSLTGHRAYVTISPAFQGVSYEGLVQAREDFYKGLNDGTILESTTQLCDTCLYKNDCPVDPIYKKEQAPTVITTCTEYDQN